MKKLIILFAAIIGSILLQSCFCEHDLWDYGYYGPSYHVHRVPPPPPPHRHHHW